MKKNTLISLLTICLCFTVGYVYKTTGASNFDRLVLGSANYGEDPNTTADITGQNDEYISNVTDGTWSFGAANLTTTGTITGVLSMAAGIGDTASFQKTPDTNREKFYDTTTVASGTTSSVYIVSIRKSGVPVAGDLLATQSLTGKLVVERADTTTTVEAYSWLKIK